MKAKPTAETITVGTQKKNTLKMVLPRLAAKNKPNSKIPTIQNRSESGATKSTARPVALDPLRSGQMDTNAATNIAANPLRTPLK